MSVPSFLNEHLQKVKHLQQQLVAYRAKTDALSRQVESLEETKIRQATELGTWKEALYDWKSIAEARTAELAGDSADRIAFLEEALAKAKQRPSAEQLAHWRGQAELEKNSSRSLAAQLEEALAEEHKTRTLLEPLTNYSGSLSSSVEALIVLHREEICRVTTELAESQETITGLQLDMARLEGRYEDLENVVADNTEELTMQQNRIEALDEEALQLRIKSASENAGHQETIERLTMALEQREREMPIDTQGQVAQMKHRIEELGEEVTSHQLREESLNEARADLELHVASLQDELVRVRESVAESQSDVPPERAAQAVIDHLTEQLRVLETRKEEETALLRLTIEDLQEQLNEESSSSDMEPPTEVRQRIVVPPFRLATAYDPPVRLASILDRWAANPLLAQMLNTTVN
ncbi:MAG: uncharacterized protein KVP18_002532 [Porospora cf. gigantea A]|uniref:uncharacterized protein n=1 Tax=Porospora cf. gigantea A TaxID=2853593 RepID=UPI00355A9C38|nr:MAG: hypothetical protein KVP18_002532 [Porospora cf. gigantea A]